MIVSTIRRSMRSIRRSARIRQIRSDCIGFRNRSRTTRVYVSVFVVGCILLVSDVSVVVVVVVLLVVCVYV